MKCKTKDCKREGTHRHSDKNWYCVRCVFNLNSNESYECLKSNSGDKRVNSIPSNLSLEDTQEVKQKKSML